ncbi:MAG: 3-phosphoshikimate 1-carboxyvinyltransferase [Chloroflexota bacterium]
MNVRIHRSEPCGAVKVPTSKSYTIRAALCAAMAPGYSLIRRPLESDDTNAALACLEALGATVTRLEDSVAIEGGSLRAPAGPLWCNESAATMRFLMALAAAVPGTTVLRCAPSLARRPMSQLCDVLSQLGAACEVDRTDGAVTVHGVQPHRAGIAMQGDLSSQYVSALLLSGPLYPAGLRITLRTPLVSSRYVDMTLGCMKAFGVTVEVIGPHKSYLVPAGGYSATGYEVEGDWSAAAPILALGAVSGAAGVLGLSPQSLQADVLMLTLLKQYGASVTRDFDSVFVKRSGHCPFEIDISEAIDLLPVAMVLGATARGVTTIHGIARARDKESDRVAAMVDGLHKMGVELDTKEDSVTLKGDAAHGAVVSSYGDHRIAMAFGVLGAVVGDTTVLDAECVAKTYPDFWKDMQHLRVQVDYDE